MTEPELVSLDEAAKILGFTKLYTRTLVRRGKLKTKKVQVGPASQVWKHMVLRSDVEDYGKGAARKVRSSRLDGRYRYTMYASPEELEEIKRILFENKLGEVADLIVHPTNTSAYRRRKQKAAAKVVKDASNRQSES